jgi:hypothetical protein
MAKEKGTTLRQLSKLTGISYKSIQAAFDRPDAPTRTRPVEELVDFVRKAVPGAVQLPPDITERMILLKFETAQERKKRETETAEKLRLHNLERKGLLVERGEVRAQGAAVGMLLSSTISGWVKDLPAELVGKPELEITRALNSKADALIASIREALGKLA